MPSAHCLSINILRINDSYVKLFLKFERTDIQMLIVGSLVDPRWFFHSFLSVLFQVFTWSTVLNKAGEMLTVRLTEKNKVRFKKSGPFLGVFKHPTHQF